MSKYASSYQWNVNSTKIQKPSMASNTLKSCIRRRVTISSKVSRTQSNTSWQGNLLAVANSRRNHQANLHAKLRSRRILERFADSLYRTSVLSCASVICTMYVYHMVLCTISCGVRMTRFTGRSYLDRFAVSPWLLRYSK
jgi:hypothetical protein